LLKLEIYCDDHSSLSSTTAVPIRIISYVLDITECPEDAKKDFNNFENL